MEEFLKKSMVQKYKYTIVIVVVYNGLQWYFSLRVAVLWLLYMVVFGAQSLAFAGVYFVISLVGQCIGAWFKDKKIVL